MGDEKAKLKLVTLESEVDDKLKALDQPLAPS